MYRRPEDHVHHACSHATTWSSAGSVDWIADSALIIGEVGPAFSWSRVLDLARFDRSTVAVKTLAAALSEVLGVPVPPRGSRRRGLGGRRPAVVERAEISLRGRAPHELSRTAELFLDLQEHRRRSSELHGKPLVASIPSFAKKQWRVDGVRGAVAQAAYCGPRPAPLAPALSCPPSAFPESRCEPAGRLRRRLHGSAGRDGRTEFPAQRVVIRGSRGSLDRWTRSGDRPA